jgi:hypothetical protein
MIEVTESVKPCDCGRNYCEFFDAGAGELGMSFNREELLSELNDIPGEIERLERLKNHLTKLLATR